MIISPIIEEFLRFLTIGLSDSAKGLQTKEKALISLRALKHGAAGENRTLDPILTKDVRYHYATAAKMGVFLTYFYKKVKENLNKRHSFLKNKTFA